MGRGAAWGDVECGHLARAWKVVGQDPVIGIEQTSNTFFKKMYELFCSMRPSSAGDKEYIGRGQRAARSKFETISADVSKFKIALREVRAFKPTGTTEKQNLSMAIARHLGKTANVSYEAKDFDHATWTNHLAYNELKDLPKFSMMDSSSSTLDIGNQRDLSESDTPSHPRAQPESSANSSQQSPTPSTPSSSRKRKEDDSRGGFVGRKRAKADIVKFRQNEKALQNASLIASSLKCRTELMEEGNAMKAFSLSECVTEDDRKDRAEFMKLIRKAHLQRMRQQLTPAIESQQSQDANECDELPTASHIPTPPDFPELPPSPPPLPPQQ